jgi:hypothetical protein
MAKGSNNRFPQIVFTEQATPPTPDDALVDGEWLLYMDTDNKLYKVDHAAAATEVGGGSGTPVAVGARVKRASGTVALTTTYAAIAFTDEDYDTDGFHDNSTNNTRLTVPTGKAGKYHITACGYGDNISLLVTLRVSGTPIAVAPAPNIATVAIAPFNISADYTLAEGNYVELFIRTNTGSGNLAYDAGLTPILSMHLIGT